MSAQHTATAPHSPTTTPPITSQESERTGTESPEAAIAVPIHPASSTAHANTSGAAAASTCHAAPGSTHEAAAPTASSSTAGSITAGRRPRRPSQRPTTTPPTARASRTPSAQAGSRSGAALSASRMADGPLTATVRTTTAGPRHRPRWCAVTPRPNTAAAAATSTNGCSQRAPSIGRHPRTATAAPHPANTAPTSRCARLRPRLHCPGGNGGPVSSVTTAHSASTATAAATAATGTCRLTRSSSIGVPAPDTHHDRSGHHIARGASQHVTAAARQGPPTSSATQSPAASKAPTARAQTSSAATSRPWPETSPASPRPNAAAAAPTASAGPVPTRSTLTSTAAAAATTTTMPRPTHPTYRESTCDNRGSCAVNTPTPGRQVSASPHAHSATSGAAPSRNRATAGIRTRARPG